MDEGLVVAFTPGICHDVLLDVMVHLCGIDFEKHHIFLCCVLAEFISTCTIP